MRERKPRALRILEILTWLGIIIGACILVGLGAMKAQTIHNGAPGDSRLYTEPTPKPPAPDEGQIHPYVSYNLRSHIHKLEVAMEDLPSPSANTSKMISDVTGNIRRLRMYLDALDQNQSPYNMLAVASEVYTIAYLSLLIRDMQETDSNNHGVLTSLFDASSSLHTDTIQLTAVGLKLLASLGKVGSR